MTPTDLTNIARKFWLRACQASRYGKCGDVASQRASLDDCNAIYATLVDEFSSNPDNFELEVAKLLREGREQVGRTKPLDLEIQVTHFVTKAEAKRRRRIMGRLNCEESRGPERSAVCFDCRAFLSSKTVWVCKNCGWMRCPECGACECKGR